LNDKLTLLSGQAYP